MKIKKKKHCIYAFCPPTSSLIPPKRTALLVLVTTSEVLHKGRGTQPVCLMVLHFQLSQALLESVFVFTKCGKNIWGQKINFFRIIIEISRTNSSLKEKSKKIIGKTQQNNKLLYTRQVYCECKETKKQRNKQTNKQTNKKTNRKTSKQIKNIIIVA